MMKFPVTSLNRRRMLKLAGGVMASPYIIGASAQAPQKLVVRTPGGARDEVLKEMLYDPFRKETGIEIVPVPANSSKMVAMVRAGAAEIDVADTSTDALRRLTDVGGLLPIPYAEFKLTNPEDISADLKSEFAVANSTYSTMLGYNKDMIGSGKVPQSWAEFWDYKGFPGPRSLSTMEANNADLEFALLADGVPMDKLYPLDLDRAFRMLALVRPGITKFWESGGVSTQMLIDKEVALSTIWSTRLSIAMGNGAPLGGVWNQNRVEVQAYGIFKSTKMQGAAVKYVDYALSAPVQSRILQKMEFVPSNSKAFGAMPKSLIDPATNTPWTVSKGFMMNISYWAGHQPEAAKRWAQFLIQK